MFKCVDGRRTTDQAYTITSPSEPSAQVSEKYLTSDLYSMLRLTQPELRLPIAFSSLAQMSF